MIIYATKPISPEILAQIVEERKLAQKSASDAKNSANEAVEALENCVKKTGEVSQTVDGTLDVKELKENGNRVYSPNNKPTASDVGALSTDGGTVTGDLTAKNITANTSLTVGSAKATYSATGLNFDKPLLINGAAALKEGDGGLNVNTQTATNDINIDNYDFKVGFYSGNNWTSTKGLPFGSVSPHEWFYLLNQNLATSGSNYKFQILGLNQRGANRLAIRYKVNVVFTDWAELITTANSTVDSNGFLKSASPILRLFANDDVDTVDGFEKSGCGLINSEAKGVTATKIAVGHYEIHGSLGFAKEGWYITLPEDANGNKKLFAKYSTDENNVITIKTYTKKFDFEKCEVVAGEPQDITDGRWIDIRLEMPIIEIVEQIEPIPSTLNPIIS